MSINESNRVKKQVMNDAKYKEGVKYAIELNRRIANMIGIWPVLSYSSKSSKINFDIIAKYVKNTFFYFLLTFLLVPGIMHIILEENTLKRRIMKVRKILSRKVPAIVRPTI